MSVEQPAATCRDSLNKLAGACSHDRLRFAARYGLRHLLLSLLAALLSAGVVFGLWYPSPWSQMLEVGHIYLLVLMVDVVCGPLLTLILSNPRKSGRERWLDFSLIGLLQIAALVYGMHSVWMARPTVLVFEADRLVMVAANEVQVDELAGMTTAASQLPWAGILKMGTRTASSNEEMMESVQLSLVGISPAMRPSWWIPWEETQETMRHRAKPLAELIARRPMERAALEKAASTTQHSIDQLSYLPLVSRKTLDWIALLDEDMNILGCASVEGF